MIIKHTLHSDQPDMRLYKQNEHIFKIRTIGAITTNEACASQCSHSSLNKYIYIYIYKRYILGTLHT